jgi:DNA topoisomerase-2
LYGLQELILFSRADLERSIPCMVDGLKPGQRKILFACFKRNLRKDIKVSDITQTYLNICVNHTGMDHVLVPAFLANV